ncbi:PulJ/GspJ family protein [Campylobacter vulpis]|uniref:PulJ/GspJ family protein n=1 Tax=Campylobacter vulpis TaxID=1655500 RepID=UPI001BCE65C4|nr:prepilin-type N-terminal cleavage/methylation domain-containing protein [Campylobacter vulpis]MBS4314320.1 prepilin-type N-terminal cleavage/methylation domain-containing protein [Campylobacter vulpis]
MKKAFSLLELMIVLIIFSIIFMLMAKPLREFYLLHLKSLEQNEVILKLNQTLFNLENILLKCVNLEFTNENFSCFLKDDESIFVLENGKLKLVNSMLILKNHTSFYSPKSDFVHLLQNKIDLFKDKDGSFYALKDGKVELLNPANFQSEGVFYPLKAKVEFKFEDNALKYTLKPKIFNENLKQEALLLDFVQDFRLREQNGALWIKICVQKSHFSHCLEKMLIL